MSATRGDGHTMDVLTLFGVVAKATQKYLKFENQEQGAGSGSGPGPGTTRVGPWVTPEAGWQD
jgi:hypothetical protein